ncbi:MAG: alpha/beta hydrolase [Chloroflexi bacterium]|nr:alpha/beta hydrolase [Chloroflexota bacterium]
MPNVNVNGFDLYYADDDFADPWKPHDAVLMQHFVFGNHTQFRPWVPTLARELRVLRLDRRGSGLSAKPGLDYLYNLDDLLSDFAGFLDALGIERVHYIGDSLGGVLGAAFAATHPERVKSLVLCATPCWIKPPTRALFAREGYADGPTAVTAMGSWIYAVAGVLHARPAEATVEAQLRALYRAEQTAMTPAHVIASLMRMVTQPDFNITPLLPKVQAPTLLLSPSKSIHTTPDEQTMMLQTIPNCRQVLFEDANHGIAFDEPERCAEEALGFIRKHSA